MRLELNLYHSCLLYKCAASSPLFSLVQNSKISLSQCVTVSNPAGSLDILYIFGHYVWQKSAKCESFTSKMVKSTTVKPVRNQLNLLKVSRRIMAASLHAGRKKCIFSETDCKVIS